jgi:MoaD family protein
MARIEINYYSTYAKITGKSHEIIEIDEPTLGNLIDQVRNKYGEKLDAIMWDEKAKDLKKGMSVLVNGRNLPFDTKLKNSDQVAFLILMAGG